MRPKLASKATITTVALLFVPVGAPAAAQQPATGLPTSSDTRVATLVDGDDRAPGGTEGQLTLGLALLGLGLFGVLGGAGAAVRSRAAAA